MNYAHFLASAALAAVAAPGSAQAPFGMPTGFSCDVQALTGNPRCLGVCRTVEPNGIVRFWVSAAANPQVVPNPHLLYEIDAACNLVAAHSQPTAFAAGNTWGIRDLAWDGGDLIYGGHELVNTGGMIFAFRLSTRAWDPLAFVGPVGPAAPPTIRALAYRPGKPGTAPPRLYTSDFGGPGAWVDATTGAAFPIPATGGVSVYGAGFDPTTDRVFWYGQAGDTNPVGHGVNISDMDAAMPMLPVSNWCYADRSVPGATPGGIAGGADVFLNAAGQPRMVTLHQATSDTITIVSVELSTGPTAPAGGISRPVFSAGAGPAFLEMFPNQPAYDGNAAWGLRLTNYATPPVPPGSVLAVFYFPGGPIPPLPLFPPFVPGANLLCSPVPSPFLVGIVPILPVPPTPFPLPLPPVFPDLTPLWFQGFIINLAPPIGWSTQRAGITVYWP